MIFFYLTGLTGFHGYFFGFPDESQKFQLPTAKKIFAIKLKSIAQFDLLAANLSDNFSRTQGGIGFRHFLQESGEEKNPNNPVNPVQNIRVIGTNP